MIDRRTFIQGAAFIGATPAIAALFSLLSPAQRHLSPVSSRLPQTAETEMNANSIVFKIDGWDCGADTALDRSSATMVLIRISQSWRTTWR